MIVSPFLSAYPPFKVYKLTDDTRFKENSELYPAVAVRKMYDEYPQICISSSSLENAV